MPAGPPDPRVILAQQAAVQVAVADNEEHSEAQGEGAQGRRPLAWHATWSGA